MPSLMRIGQVILQRYEITDLIREGGQGSLAKAIDLQTQQVVAIKQLTATPDQKHYAEELARFQRVGKLRSGHPVVVDAIDVGEENGEWYLVFPFVDGDELQIHLQRHRGKLPCKDALPIIRRVAEGLAVLHSQGITHRDIKPENILITASGSVHLVDLGICHCANEQTVTGENAILGTLPWVAPEQLNDPRTVDNRTDLYALGLIAYFGLTGVCPVEGTDSASIVQSIVLRTPPSPRQREPSIPDHVDRAVMRLLAKDPAARFQTAEEFIQALDGNASAPQFCAFCGRPRESSAKFCPLCGADLVGGNSSMVRCLACGAPPGENNACAGCRRSFSPANHRLVCFAGALAGRTLVIPVGIYEVGRTQLEPRDFLISRRHFRVACTNGVVQIEDAGSANGTYVAGQLAEQPIQLLSGQELGFAGNRATYTSK